MDHWEKEQSETSDGCGKSFSFFFFKCILVVVGCVRYVGKNKSTIISFIDSYGNWCNRGEDGTILWERAPAWRSPPPPPRKKLMGLLVSVPPGEDPWRGARKRDEGRGNEEGDVLSSETSREAASDSVDGCSWSQLDQSALTAAETWNEFVFAQKCIICSFF